MTYMSVVSRPLIADRLKLSSFQLPLIADRLKLDNF